MYAVFFYVELRVLLEYHVMWNILYIDEMERLNLINSHVWHVSTVLKDSKYIRYVYTCTHTSHFVRVCVCIVCVCVCVCVCVECVSFSLLDIKVQM